MLDSASVTKKNKISLHDYPSQQDIENRILLSDCSVFDIEAIEEILFSPLKIPLKKLARQLSCEEGILVHLLKKLQPTGLVSVENDTILIDKEMRKYFEFHLRRFQADFKPDLEYIHGILRKVPIHLLPAWYSIPRTSNNIFESIVEKYLLTPHIYQKSLTDLSASTPLCAAIIRDLWNAPDFTLLSSDLIAKYNLKRKEFEELLLLLEFHFVCCVYYRKQEDHWVELITPFYEWHQHLRFLQQTEAPLIQEKDEVIQTYKSDFAFVEEMTEILQSIRKRGKFIEQIPQQKAIEKLCLIGLADIVDRRLIVQEEAASWLEMSLENKALHLYRHLLNRLPIAPSQAHVREAEKAIKRALHGEWVYFDDFVKGSLVAVSEKSVVVLKKIGKHWKYELPSYTEQDKLLIRATIFEWLFEAGMVRIGTCKGRDCFSVTSFGRFLFEE